LSGDANFLKLVYAAFEQPGVGNWHCRRLVPRSMGMGTALVEPRFCDAQATNFQQWLLGAAPVHKRPTRSWPATQSSRLAGIACRQIAGGSIRLGSASARDRRVSMRALLIGAPSFSMLVCTKFSATSFRELPKDVRGMVYSGPVLKIEFRPIISFKDSAHHLLGSFHYSSGREEPQFSHGRVERNDFRRVLDRGLQ
jgi:hypothetical protein